MSWTAAAPGRRAKPLSRTLELRGKKLLMTGRTRVTHACGEAAILGARSLKRAAREYRNYEHCRLRLLLDTAAPRSWFAAAPYHCEVYGAIDRFGTGD